MVRLSSLSYRFFLAYIAAASSIILITILLEQLHFSSITNLFIFILLTGLTFILLHFYFSKIYLRPLDNLIEISKKIATSSDENIRAEKFNEDKIGDLVDAFNELVSQLQLRQESIIAERDRSAIALEQADAYADVTLSTNKKLKAEVLERKKIEIKLTEFQTFLKSIIDSMPSALVTIDQSLTVTQWNQGASRLSGTIDTEAIGKTVEKAFPLISEHIEWVTSAMENQTSQTLHNIRYAIDDRIRHFNIVIYPLKNIHKLSAVVRIDDVTEQHKMEEAIIQSEKISSLGGMAAGMAHEINNPISAIIQNAQNIQRRIDINLPANKVQAENDNIQLDSLNSYLEKRKIIDFLNNISEAGLRASNLVKNMLQFSRGGEIARMPCRVTEIIQKAIDIAVADDNLSAIQGNLQINIDQDVQTPDLHVLAVFSELEQVMLNLIKNSADAIYERKLTLNDIDEGVIRIQQSVRNKLAIITVSDNGIGMKKDTSRHAFEPFFTTKDVGVGTGLGLSVSYFIVNTHHNGRMQIESKYGHGSVFEISIPIYIED